jgi:hypothetical protein
LIVADPSAKPGDGINGTHPAPHRGSVRREVEPRFKLIEEGNFLRQPWDRATSVQPVTPTSAG